MKEVSNAANGGIGGPTHIRADACCVRFGGISKRHWSRMVDAGKAPQPVRLGRLCLWSVETLEEWERGGCKPVRTVKKGGA